MENTQKKIVFLPLDERPCNYAFPQKLFGSSVQLAVPVAEILGDKKKPANVEKIISFLTKECLDADALVLSLDMLLYGGLLPSRLHFCPKDVLDGRLAVLKTLKEHNPSLKIYASTLIMRCPKYSSSDEEPDYYADCGAEIHRFGALTHMRSLGLEVDEGELAALQKRIPQEDLQDFLSRRANNLIYNQKAIDLRKEGIIDCLVIPQDDSAPYGYTAIDQTVVRDHISDVGLTAQVLMYPGADEVGLTLLTRCVLAFAHKKPKVYVKYAAEHADGIIPSYEDRPLGETVKYHILAAGGRKVDSYRDADCVLCFTANSRGMSEAKYQAKHTVEYDCFRNLPELIDFIKDAVQDGKPVILADNAYANGGDLQLLKCLQSEGLLDKLAAYAGWNTNANTLGTALAQGLLYLLEGGTASHYNFLALRYLEDLGYCSKVRFAVTANELEKRGFNYFWVQDRRGEIAAIVKAQLEKFLHEELPSLEGQIAIKDVYMPWRRMFEVGIDAEWWRGEKV